MAKDKTGDTARQMAAAPLTHNTTHGDPGGDDALLEKLTRPDKPQDKPINRFDGLDGNGGIYTAVIFEAVDSTRINEREGSGQKSRKLASVLVEQGGSNAYIRGSIYARLEKGQTKPWVEFTWTGTQFASAIVVKDEQAKAEMMTFRRTLADRFVAWRKEHGSTPITRANSTGPELDDVTF